MPDAAAGFADVGAGDPQPLVLGRRGQHALQQLPVAGLELGALLQLAPRRADPGCERVANRLQVAEVERPRLSRDGSDSGVDLQPRESLGDKPAELRFEAADLTP